MRRGTTNSGAVMVCMIALVTCMGCGGDGTFFAPPQVIETGAPFFQGIKSAITAGGARIRVCWAPATDDLDSSSAIVYRVYLSATSDGHDFSFPNATSAPGVTCIQLTSATSPLIAVGAEVFVVVRAVDTNGAEDENTVECAVTCVPTNAVAYVRQGEGAGALGDPGMPFPTIQAGIDAIPASGGAVVVAGGIYSELPAATEPGIEGTVLAIFGSFEPGTIHATTNAADLLEGNDPDDHPSVIDGAGEPGEVQGQTGHMDVRNHGRRTYVAGFRFEDEQNETLFGGVGVNLVISCCAFVDPNPQNDDNSYPGEGIRINGDESNPALSIDIVGCSFDGVDRDNDFDTCINLVSGRYGRIRVGTCLAQESGAFLVSEEIETAPGSAFNFHFEGNWLTRLSGHVFYLHPRGDGSGGSTDIQVRGNRLTGCLGECEVSDFGAHGADGTIDVLCENNFIGPTEGHGLKLRFIPDFSEREDPTLASEINVTVRDNDFANLYGEAFHLQNLNLTAGADATVTVERCSIVQINMDDALDVDFSDGIDPEATEFSQDGATLDMTVRDVVAVGTGALLDFDHGVFRGGSVDLTIESSVADETASDDEDEEDSLEINLYGFMTNVTAGPPPSSRASVRVIDSLFVNADDEEAIDIEVDVAAAETVCDVLRNDMIGGDDVLEIDFTFPEEGFFEEELLAGNGSIFQSEARDLFATIEGNRLIGSGGEDTIDVDFSGMTEATAHVNICNNFTQSGEDGIDLDANAYGLRGFVLIAYNTFAAAPDDENLDLDFNDASTWSVLIARNAILGAEEEDGGVELGIDNNVMGADMMVRNNVVAFGGQGVLVNESMQGAQMINNTIAFTGRESGDVPLGSENGGRNSPVHVANSISHGNSIRDMPSQTIATYSLLGHPPESAGFGSLLLNDPVFQRFGSSLEVNRWFRLAAHSPARDIGNPDPDFNDPDGTRNDAGAFGGPGAGDVGTLESFSTPCPFLAVGVDPLLDLYAGVHLIGGRRAVSVVFNADVNAASVNPGSLAFVGPTGAIAGTYATVGRRVIFTPSADWPAGAEIRIDATTVLQSDAGHPLDFRHVRWFATQPATTLPENDIQIDSQLANNTPSEANDLGSGPVVVVTGSVGNGDDSDFFRVTGTAGTRLQASLFGQRLFEGPVLLGTSGFVDFCLRVHDADGNNLLYENSWALQFGDPMIDFTLPATGSYLIEVCVEFAEGNAPYELEVWLHQP